MKKITSLLLVVAMLLSVGVFAIHAAPVPSGPLERVTVDRSFDIKYMNNLKLYRFKASVYSTAAGASIELPYTDSARYTWAIYDDAAQPVDLASVSYEQNRDYFAFAPPALNATYSVICTVQVADGTEKKSAVDASDSVSWFSFSPKLPESKKDALKLAISLNAFKQEKLYTAESWARYLGAYYDAVDAYKDGTYSEGKTLGGVSDEQRLVNLTLALNEAATVKTRGVGLIEDPNASAFTKFLSPLIEKISAIVWGLAGFKLTGLDIPFSNK
ncbi:MAG: hypothetical protein LBN05_02935 [Oscillospiraceae bacterium]|jgi:hypothetical protein|nr:hypothetical protein [Oscillospiraceae bacterium]